MAVVKSIESGRITATAYSKDLRWRIVWQHIAMGLKFIDIAENLWISAGTAYNIVKRLQLTGDVGVKKHPKKDKKLDQYHEIYIINLILDSPSLQLKEISSEVSQITGTTVSSSTLCRLLARYGFTRKKNPKNCFTKINGF